MSDKTFIDVDYKDEWECPKGHKPHLTGNGFHKHKNKRRKNTRQSQKQEWLEEYEDLQDK